jgi:hypothetical protein
MAASEEPALETTTIPRGNKTGPSSHQSHTPVRQARSLDLDLSVHGRSSSDTDRNLPISTSLALSSSSRFVFGANGRFPSNERNHGNYVDDVIDNATVTSTATAQVKVDYLPRGAALDILHQYNAIVSRNHSLRTRSLPPIQISIRPTGAKDSTKRVTRRHRTGSLNFDLLSRQKQSNEQLVFTEGISSISKKQDPSFSMRTKHIHKSNLPDTVRLARENSRIAFGLTNMKLSKKELPPTPRFRPMKTFGLESSNLSPSSPRRHASKHSTEYQKQWTNSPLELVTSNSKSGSRNGHSFNDKTKLAPIVTVSKEPQETSKQPQEARKQPQESSKQPQETSSNSSPEHDLLTHHLRVPLNTPMSLRASRLESGSDRSREVSGNHVSVVSIGDAVTPTFHERPRRYIQSQYPMFDSRYGNQEQYRRQVFSESQHKSNTSERLRKSTLAPITVTVTTANQAMASTELRSELRIGKKTGRQHRQGNSTEEYYHNKAMRRMAARSQSASSDSTGVSQNLINPPPPSTAASNNGTGTDDGHQSTEHAQQYPAIMLPVQEERTMSPGSAGQYDSSTSRDVVVEDPGSERTRSQHGLNNVAITESSDHVVVDKDVSKESSLASAMENKVPSVNLFVDAQPVNDTFVSACPDTSNNNRSSRQLLNVPNILLKEGRPPFAVSIRQYNLPIEMFKGQGHDITDSTETIFPMSISPDDRDKKVAVQTLELFPGNSLLVPPNDHQSCVSPSGHSVEFRVMSASPAMTEQSDSGAYSARDVVENEASSLDAKLSKSNVRNQHTVNNTMLHFVSPIHIQANAKRQ